MGVLNKAEIEQFIGQGQLVRYPRYKDGALDIQPDSYDLTAGKAVWKNSRGKITQPLLYDPLAPREKQQTHSVRPGEMVFVITHEDIVMPKELCGTVYTKNSIAMAGILALNAGHVDPGYDGPIVIRLINIRSIPWVLTMGDPIFTVVFQTLNYEAPIGRQAISANDMLKSVQTSASESLSNALYDLYALRIDERLLEHQSSMEARLRESLAEDFVRRDQIWSALVRNLLLKIIAAVVLLAAIGTAIVRWRDIFKFISGE